MGKHLSGGVQQTVNVGEEVISGRIVFGATGAVASTFGKGFSVARTAQGRFTITLRRPYKKLLEAQAEMIYAAYGSIDKLECKFSNDSTSTLSAPTIMLLTRPGDSTTLTDPASGDSVGFSLRFLKSRVSQ